VLAQQGMNALDTDDYNEYNKILLSINQQFIHTQLCGEPGKGEKNFLEKFFKF